MHVFIFIVSPQYNLPTQKPDDMPPPDNCSVDNALTVAQHTAYVRTAFTLLPSPHEPSGCVRVALCRRTYFLVYTAILMSVQRTRVAAVLLSRWTLIAGDAVVLGVT